MLTFWRHGYESTSVAELTSAMGVSAPSLYTAFGDKKQLFLEAVRLYAGDPQDMAHAINDAPSAHAAARDLMTIAATTYTGDGSPRGCLLASATACGSSASADVQMAVALVRRDIEEWLKLRIERDIADSNQTVRFGLDCRNAAANQPRSKPCRSSRRPSNTSRRA